MINPIVLNTKSGANTELAAIAIMNAVVGSKLPADVVTYSSSACSHDEIDEHYKKTVGDLQTMIDLCEDFVHTCRKYKIYDPFFIKGSIPQKIVKDVPMPKGLVSH